MRKLLLALAAAVSLHAADPVSLFNGKDLTGWTMVGPGRFVVENGMLKTEGGMGLLYYNGQMFGDQTIRVVYKTTGATDNSGVYVRLPEPPPDPWYAVHNGYEIQIDSGQDELHTTGAIYSLAKATKRAQKPTGEWNTLEIELQGPVTRVKVNGEQVSEYKDGQAAPERKQHYEPVRGPRPNKGYIGLQNHDPKSVVYFKEISVVGGTATPPAAPLSSSDRDKLISHFHATRKMVLDAVSNMSDAQWTFKAADNKWSARDIVEHLTLVEDGLFKMAMGGLQKSAAKPQTPMDDDKFMAGVRDRSRAVEAPAMFRPSGKWSTKAELIEEFKSRRDRNLAVLRAHGENGLLRSSYIQGPAGTLEVYQMLLMVPAHVERHLAQLREVTSDPKFPK